MISPISVADQFGSSRFNNAHIAIQGCDLPAGHLWSESLCIFLFLLLTQKPLSNPPSWQLGPWTHSGKLCGTEAPHPVEDTRISHRSWILQEIYDGIVLAVGPVD